MNIIFASTIPKDQHDAVRNASHFRRWLERTRTAFQLRSVHVRDVGMFGRRVGFIFVEAEALHDGQVLPKYAFLRGDSASILVVLKCPGLPDRTVLTCEARLPIGKVDLLSLPAGMVDDGSFDSTALRELGEEIGTDLHVREEQLIHLATTWTSPGGCDEAISLFAAEMEASPELIRSLEGRRTGNKAEHEFIEVRVMALDDIPKIGMTDAKTLLSYALYRQEHPARS